MRVVITGAGIGGLTTALALHAVGIEAEVFEQSGEIRELGVGFTVLPHGVKEAHAYVQQSCVRAEMAYSTAKLRSAGIVLAIAASPCLPAILLGNAVTVNALMLDRGVANVLAAIERHRPDLLDIQNRCSSSSKLDQRH